MQSTLYTHRIVTVEDNVVLRANEYLCSKSDSTMWSSWAVARSAVLPSENRNVTKTNTEKGDAATCCDVCRQRKCEQSQTT